MNSAKVGFVASVSSAAVPHCVGMLVCAANAKMVVELPSIFLSPAITRTGSSSSNGVFSVLSVGSRDRTPAAWCLKRARSKMLKSKSDRLSRASPPVESAKFKVHRSESCSVRRMNRVPSRCGPKGSIHRTISKHSR